MSLEQALAENTAALQALTAALAKGGAAAAAPAAAPAAEKPPKGKKEAAAPAAPSIDRSTVNAALEEVKNKHGVEAAKKVIKEAGGVDKRADIPDDKLQAVYDAAKKAAEGGGEDDDI